MALKPKTGKERSVVRKRSPDRAASNAAETAPRRRRKSGTGRRQAANSFAVRIAGTRTYVAYAILLAVAAIVLAMLYAAAPAHGQEQSAPQAAATPGGDPMAVAKDVIDQAIAVFRDKELSDAERMKRLRAIAEAHIDFADMARSAVGYHWRSLTPEQQAEFVPLFTKFIEDVVLSRIESYSVRKIQSEIATTAITFTREEFTGSGEAQVYSTVVVQDRPNPLKVDYQMHQKEGRWMIYDISVDAISVIANYRNQFNRVINNQGYDKLVSILREKTRSLNNSLSQ